MANYDRNKETWDLELIIENDVCAYECLVEMVRERGEEGVSEFVQTVQDDLERDMRQADGLGAYAIEYFIDAVDWDALTSDLIDDMREEFPEDEDETETEAEEVEA